MVMLPALHNFVFDPLFDAAGERLKHQAVVDFARELLPDILFLIWFRELMSTPVSSSWPAPSFLGDETMQLLGSIDWLMVLVEQPSRAELDTLVARIARMRTLSRAELQEFARGSLDGWFTEIRRRDRRRRDRTTRTKPTLHDFYLLGINTYLPPHSVALAAEYLVTPEWREHYRPLVQLDGLAGKLT